MRLQIRFKPSEFYETCAKFQQEDDPTALDDTVEQGAHHTKHLRIMIIDRILILSHFH